MYRNIFLGLTLILFLAFNCSNTRQNAINTEIKAIGKESKMTPKLDVSKYPYMSLDSSDYINKGGGISRSNFYHDKSQGIDTLIVYYGFSKEEEKLFSSGVIIGGGSKKQFFDMALGKMAFNNNGKVSLTVRDSVPNILIEEYWQLDEKKKEWLLGSSMKKEYKNDLLVKHENGFGTIIYTYKDSLLLKDLYYRINGKDSSIVRQKIFFYDPKGNQIEKQEGGFSDNEQKVTTWRKTEYKYDTNGRLINEKHFEKSYEGVIKFEFVYESTTQYNNDGLKTYFESKEMLGGFDFNVTYFYDEYGNCVSQSIKRDDQGYNIGKKDFKYDDQQRLISYVFSQKQTPQEKFDTTEIKVFEYFENNAYISREQRGRSFNAINGLKAKSNFVYDEFGNVVKIISSEGVLIAENKLDYNIPIETVHSKHAEFFQTHRVPNLTLQGVSSKYVKTKFTHAPIEKTTFKSGDGSVNNRRLFYYSEK